LCGKIGASIDAGIEYPVGKTGEVCRDIAVSNKIHESPARFDRVFTTMKYRNPMPRFE
jgi:hypothetical protein